MQVYRIGLMESDCPPAGIVILGNFDGVHRGHQSLFDVAKGIAQAENLPILVLTFDPPPQDFFKISTFQKIQTLSQKLATFESYGILNCILLKFDEALASLSPAEFVERLLIEKLHAKHVIVGSDFRFGRSRRGSAADLQQWQGKFGVHVVPPLCFEGMPISSTWIRSCLQQGQVKLAHQLLGRPFTHQGVVCTGQQRGRSIGFPTANISVAPDFLVKGVYAVEARWAEYRYCGVANVGTRPTVQGTDWVLEVHLPGYTGDLYGQTLDVLFLEKLRDERQFASLDALKMQIAADVQAAAQFCVTVR
ncbi:MAG: bifunctional riboflavin kinase/FAD synthetase [Pseudomonadota bacterium]